MQGKVEGGKREETLVKRKRRTENAISRNETKIN